MEKNNHFSFFQKRPLEERECIYQLFNKADEINDTPFGKIPNEIVDTIIHYFTEEEFVKTFGLISNSTYHLADSIIQANGNLKVQKYLYQTCWDPKEKRLKQEDKLALEKKAKYYGNVYGKLFRPVLAIALIANVYFLNKLYRDSTDNPKPSDHNNLKLILCFASIALLAVLLIESPSHGESIAKLYAKIKNNHQEGTKQPRSEFKLS